MAAAYIGAVVGAGFASGQEALTFFVIYGNWGILGILVVMLGFAVIGALSFTAAQELGIESYKELLATISNPSWARIYDIVITCFLLAGVGVMLAGAGSLAEQQWGLPALSGVGTTAVITGISCYLGIEGVFHLNACLVPVMAAAAASLGLLGLGGLWTKKILQAEALALWSSTPSSLVPNWWLGAIIYLSYNSMLGIAACTPLAASLPRRKWAVWGGVAGGLTLGLMLLGSCLAIWDAGHEAAQMPVPLAWIASKAGPGIGSVYGVIIWFAMLTTAATNLYAVVKRLGQNPKPGLLGVLLALSFGLSLLGFSSLIELLYPFFGYLGWFYGLQIVIYYWRRWRSARRRK